MGQIPNSTCHCDVLIIGGGIAGLTAAVELVEQGAHVKVIVREGDPLVANTYMAQGGIIYPQGTKESGPLALRDDIIKASSDTSSDAAIEILIREGESAVKEILIDKLKTPFSRSKAGELSFTKEAAHSEARIIYRGDFTGKTILTAFHEYIHQYWPHAKQKGGDQGLEVGLGRLEIMTAHTAIDLITPSHHGIDIKERYEKPRVVGAYVFNQADLTVDKILAKHTILASGGMGALYLHHTNSEGSRGDGQAMARRAGARLLNMEFVQFHPTAFFDSSQKSRFLISEALRGEGGILLNAKGEAFMEKYHEDRELAPRDVVARAISEEMVKSGHNCVYLDISFKGAAWIEDRFPTIFEFCLSRGVDMRQVPIPVVPAAHYSCGGIRVGSSGETDLQGLYAVGEVSCTGLHGANRLASTSLLEGLCWGRRAARDIKSKLAQTEHFENSRLREWELGKRPVDRALVAQDLNLIRQTMWNYVGLVRSRDRLMRASAMLRELYFEIQNFYQHSLLSDELIGLRNAVEVASAVVEASLRNKKSVGCFYKLED
jgi:L-aspartate oxidase